MRHALAAAVLALAALASGEEAPVVAVYRGTLPCPDCAGIDAELTVRARSVDLADARFWLKEARRGGHESARTLESGGPLHVRRGTPSDPGATVYELQEARSGLRRFFRRTGDGELLELDARKADRSDAVLRLVAPAR